MKTWIIVGSLLAVLAVILGAFGAHWLKARFSPEDLAIFETGVRYHIIHALSIILIGILGFHVSTEILKTPFIFFTIGIFLFSGSLYVLVLSGARWFGVITPIGGVGFIAGWLLLAYNLWKG